MADKKISALTSATTPLAGTEVLPIVQGGSTVKVSVNNLTAGKPVSATFYGAGAAPATVFDAAAGTGSDLNLRFSPAGWNTKHRLGVQYTGDGVVWSNNALMSSSTTGNLDDVSNSGSALLLETSGTLNYVTATAGANPRTFTQRFNVNSAGDFTVSTGNFVIGTAGKGIDFSANGGDVLSQYDEGTWAISDISGAGLTLTVDHAKYTRVGNLVTVNVYVTYPVTADASNAVLSLPSGLSAAKYDIGTAGTSNGAAAYALTVGGTNAMSLRATNLATLTNAALSGADVLISFTYMV